MRQMLALLVLTSVSAAPGTPGRLAITALNDPQVLIVSPPRHDRLVTVARDAVPLQRSRVTDGLDRLFAAAPGRPEIRPIVILEAITLPHARTI